MRSSVVDCAPCRLAGVRNGLPELLLRLSQQVEPILKARLRPRELKGLQIFLGPRLRLLLGNVRLAFLLCRVVQDLPRQAIRARGHES